MPLTDHLIALRELPGIGERTLAKLIAVAEGRGESLRRVLEAAPAQLADTYRLPTPAIRRLCEQRSQHLARCRWIHEELRRAGGRVLIPDDGCFPRRLRQGVKLVPPMLYVLGDTSLAKAPCVAILSSREIVDHTLAAIVAVVRAAHADGMCTAIGGMKSNHRLAAITTRAIGAQRIVVLDRGLFSAFSYDYCHDPFGCGDRRPALDRRSTLVLSPFRPEDHAAPDSGRRRDHLIAALGDVVFASQARRGGETERVCLSALAQGKEVLVWGDENRKLLRAGARALDSALLAQGLRPFLEQREVDPPAAPRSQLSGCGRAVQRQRSHGA